MAAPFTPPLFKDLGKRLQDLLFKKKYGAEKEFKTKSVADGGKLTFESTISHAAPSKDADGSAFRGNLKAKEVFNQGNAEIELNTNGSVKCAAELDQLAQGVVVKISGGHQNKKALDELHAVVDAHYRREFVSATASVDHVVGKTSFVSGAVVLGYEGLSVGGSAKADVAQVDKLDFSAGAEYSAADYTATVVCSTERAKTAGASDKDLLEVMYVHKIKPDLEVGGSVKYDLSQTKKASGALFTFGGQYGISRDITLKGKATSEGEVETAYETRVPSSNLTFLLAGKFDAQCCSANPLKEFGFGITFGDA